MSKPPSTRPTTWSDPTGSTNAMAKGARQLGAEISRNNRVTDMNQLPDGR